MRFLVGVSKGDDFAAACLRGVFLAELGLLALKPPVVAFLLSSLIFEIRSLIARAVGLEFSSAATEKYQHMFPACLMGPLTPDFGHTLSIYTDLMRFEDLGKELMMDTMSVETPRNNECSSAKFLQVESQNVNQIF